MAKQKGNDLFSQANQERIEREAPLAARMRPRTLDEFVGQEHILGHGRLLRRAIQADQLSSLIVYGPPGSGKTTLARVIANTTRSRFVTINAVLAGVADIRAITAEAQQVRSMAGERTILFIDEVHRWNKAQQDALLPWVENGTIIMIGATTENPYFSVNSALLSRSRVFQLLRLTEDNLRQVALHALADPERGYGKRRVQLDSDALDHLVRVANGDARSVLNALELAVETTPPTADGIIHIDMAVAEESIQQRAVLYDPEGDYHFDTISAFIKSLRGSDPDAALYWLARMVYAGEDPRFIFRRMLILASEDVGLADPFALGVVTAAAEAFERVGLPEGRFHLAQAALYLATTEKSNSAMGFFDALAGVEQEGEGEVPTHLKDASRDRESFGHGEGYLYPHAYRDHWVAQQYLPASLQGKVFYHPSDQGYEAKLREHVARRREEQLAAMIETTSPDDSLTYSPPTRTRDRWLQRTTQAASRYLAEIREQVFAPLALHRYDTVLDINATTGLLTWEALRQAPEGGVYTLAHDAAAAETISQGCELLAEIERPHVLYGAIQELPELLAASGEGELRFDAIIGRNALAQPHARAQTLQVLVHLLALGGRLSLAEVIPSLAQRLSDLADLSSLPQDLAAAITQAEAAIYNDPDNPSTAWGLNDLQAALEQAGLQIARLEAVPFTREQYIAPELVEAWFSSGGAKPSYADQMRSMLDEQTLQALQQLYISQLAGKVVNWHSQVAFVVAKTAEPQ
ncbi:MAG: AAA family ATPase [Chloroflexi bacterium]|nr:AAA family ATPase [Chloroflexota bacterium]